MMNAKANLRVDITIVGAGLVGLAAAVALSQAGYSVALVDSAQSVQLPDALPVIDQNAAQDWDQRIYAISPRNAQWLASLGVWQLLNPARIGEMQAMEIWGDATQTPLHLLASDVNADHLGFIVEENAVKQALMQRVEALTVHTLFDCPCAKLNVSAHRAVLQLDNWQDLNNQQDLYAQQVIESALLLAADGANSWVRQQLDIGVQQKPYEQTAVVANFVAEKSHANIARQWFMQDASGASCILAWLPLPDNKISIVWSVSTQYAEILLKLTAEEFTQQVMTAGNAILGEFKLMAMPAAFPLVLKKADVLTQGCAVLVGDAAHRIHPMAGQGVNLGFRDIMDLLEVLNTKNPYQPVCDRALLKRYTRMRKADMLNMLMLTDGLYYLFESHSGIVQKLRSWGFSAAKYPAIKKMLVAHAIAL